MTVKEVFDRLNRLYNELSRCEVEVCDAKFLREILLSFREELEAFETEIAKRITILSEKPGFKMDVLADLIERSSNVRSKIQVFLSVLKDEGNVPSSIVSTISSITGISDFIPRLKLMMGFYKQ